MSRTSLSARADLRLTPKPLSASHSAFLPRSGAVQTNSFVRVISADFDACVSCNRTCEIGMSRATAHTYVHVRETLDSLARSRENRTAKPVTTGKN